MTCTVCQQPAHLRGWFGALPFHDDTELDRDHLVELAPSPLLLREDDVAEAA